MDDLRSYFHEALVVQSDALRAARDEWLRGDSGAEHELRRLAHALRGSGTTVGFHAISRAAAALEQAGPCDLGFAAATLLDEIERAAAPNSVTAILVVDDDPLISRLLEVRLAGPDRAVITACSLAEAARLAETRTPDLVVLDLFLPDGDGRTLLASLREQAATAAAPVIVLSASADPRAEAECRRLGADAVVSKPFEPDAFAALVTGWLHRRHQTPPGLAGRGLLAAAFHALAGLGDPISVAALLAETHGPGGTSPEEPDPSVVAEVEDVVRPLLGQGVILADWGPGELGVIAPDPADELAGALDRARLRLRNRAHPSLDGAIVSFSAAVVADDGSDGMVAAYARAHEHASAALRLGGDRVIKPHAASEGRRILLAEDDALTAALVIHRLEREGFEVEHRADGRSAVEAAEAGSFGLVLLDVHMPELDGFQVLARLRADARHAAVPIVMLTAVGSERDVVRGFELGADDYILKPFSPAELTARLRRFVRRD
jgi:DNA-binding response OmpR family regulator